MKIDIVAVGRVRGPMGMAVAEYERRCRRYWSLSVVEVKSGGAGGGSGVAPEVVRRAEGARLMVHLKGGREVIGLTRGGGAMTSTTLAAHLGELVLHSSAGVIFLIGGAYGLPRRLLDRVDRRLSLSTMTLPHDLARLGLLEQLYRAGTLRRNEPDHKGSR